MTAAIVSRASWFERLREVNRLPGYVRVCREVIKDSTSTMYSDQSTTYRLYAQVPYAELLCAIQTGVPTMWNTFYIVLDAEKKSDRVYAFFDLDFGCGDRSHDAEEIITGLIGKLETLYKTAIAFTVWNSNGLGFEKGNYMTSYHIHTTLLITMDAMQGFVRLHQSEYPCLDANVYETSRLFRLPWQTKGVDLVNGCPRFKLPDDGFICDWASDLLWRASIILPDDVIRKSTVILTPTERSRERSRAKRSRQMEPKSTDVAVVSAAPMVVKIKDQHTLDGWLCPRRSVEEMWVCDDSVENRDRIITLLSTLRDLLSVHGLPKLRLIPRQSAWDLKTSDDVGMKPFVCLKKGDHHRHTKPYYIVTPYAVMFRCWKCDELNTVKCGDFTIGFKRNY